MDKYEYKVKTEQMLGYFERKQYQKAMEIADTIDWRRVKSASMLSSVSEIYEYNGENGKSREILLVAFDRSPGSRKIIYRLGTLALKLNDIEEASDCYEEFVKLAPRDPNQYILKYKILKAQEAPLTEQISALEDFKKAEYIEKWAYELAKLYHEAGMTSECLEECDDLILWFSEGKYVYKAMELKMKYKPLTPLQQQKYDNRPGAPKKAPVQEPPKEIPKAGTSPLSQLERPKKPQAANLREVISEVEKDEIPSMAAVAPAPVEAKEAETGERHSAITNVVTGSSLQEAVRAGMAIASGINLEEKAMKEKDEELRVNGQMMIDEILQEWEEKQKENAEAIEKQKEEDQERISKERAEAERRLEEERLEVEKKAAEAEEARKLAEEEAAKKAAEEEAARKAAEEEAAKKAAEEEAARKAAEEEAARKAAEEEAAKKAAEEEAARKAAEEEAARKAAEEEAAKKAAEEEAARKAAEEEAAKKAAEEEAARKVAEEEEARRIASEEIANLALEAGVLSEEEIKEKFPQEETEEAEEIPAEELEQLMAELDEEPEASGEDAEAKDLSLEATRIVSVGDELLAAMDQEDSEEDLEEADFEEEDLEEVDFEEEELEEADFEEEELEEADFEEEDLEEADFEEEEPEEVDFQDEDLEGEVVEDVDFVEADVEEDSKEENTLLDFREVESQEDEDAEVIKENFEEDFEEDDFEEDLEAADFEEEDLEEADFEEDFEEEAFEEEAFEEDDFEEETPEEELEVDAEDIPEESFEIEEDDETPEIDEFREFEDSGFDDDFEDDFDVDFEDDFEEDDFDEDELDGDDFEEDELEEEEPEEEEKISLEDLEIEEPSEEEIQERIKKSKGSGVPFDTGFVVTGRYDLSATSEIGLKAGLTEDQKKLFSYFVPVRGMSEQLVTVLDNDRRAQREGTSKTGNLIIAGRKGSGKTVLAVDIVKAIQKQRNLKQGKVAIVTGDSLNKKELTNIIQKLRGGAIIIEKAGKLNSRTIKELNYLMEKKTGELLFVLEDQRKPLERIMTAHPDFRKKFTSKLELPVFINDELVTFGQTYAKENGYKLDEMGILALYSRIDVMQREDHSVSVAEVKEIMDEAIEHSQKATAKHLARRVFGKGTDDSDRIILKEEDFKI